MFDLMRYNSYKSIARAVAREVLTDLLEYEGGELQSMRETHSCSRNNTKILKYAEAIGVDMSHVDFKALGRE